jgi:alpha-N-acetylglucosamine transferase
MGTRHLTCVYHNSRFAVTQYANPNVHPEVRCRPSGPPLLNTKQHQPSAPGDRPFLAYPTRRSRLQPPGSKHPPRHCQYRRYGNAGFFVFTPSQTLFDYYLSLLGLPGRFDPGLMEQNLLNYAHRRHGNMPWRPLWYGLNVNWPTENDWQSGVRSFHAKYSDDDPGHDPFLRAMWREQRAEMEGFYRG